jgi:hypothetical protein
LGDCVAIIPEKLLRKSISFPTITAFPKSWKILERNKCGGRGEWLKCEGLASVRPSVETPPPPKKKKKRCAGRKEPETIFGFHSPKFNF